MRPREADVVSSSTGELQIHCECLRCGCKGGPHLHAIHLVGLQFCTGNADINIQGSSLWLHRGRPENIGDVNGRSAQQQT